VPVRKSDSFSSSSSESIEDGGDVGDVGEERSLEDEAGEGYLTAVADRRWEMIEISGGSTWYLCDRT